MKKTILVTYDINEKTGMLKPADNKKLATRMVDYAESCDLGKTVNELFLECVDNGVLDGPALMSLACFGFSDSFRVMLEVKKWG